MTHPQRAFVPAAGHDWLLPFYDPLQHLLGGEALHDALLEQAALAPGHELLDVGCGTGSLAVLARRRHPGVEVTALDPDPKALAIARRKAERAGLAVRFEQGYGDALPWSDASFDRVLSSLMFHHLDLDTKRGMLREVVRVLRPGGSFHLVDFGRSGDRDDGLLTRLLHRAEHLRDQDDARIAELLREAGLRDVERTGARRLLFARVAYHRGVRPA
jgi:ubiquinone/menaquinone biosynthesis C-methylase UbiE